MTLVQQGTIFDATKQAAVIHPKPDSPVTTHKKRYFTRFVRVSPEVLNETYEPSEPEQQILLLLEERRVLLAHQIKTILFPKHHSDTVTNRYLKSLFHHQYIYRILPKQTRLENKPLLYINDHKGAALVARLKQCRIKDLKWNRDHLHLQHSKYNEFIWSNWIRIRVEQSAQEAGFTLKQWLDELTLRRAHREDIITIRDIYGQKAKTRLIPDDFFIAVSELLTLSPFVEIDTDTETPRTIHPGPTTEPIPKTWEMKVNKYNAYFALKRGESFFTKRYGHLKERVMTFTTSENRVKRMKIATEKTNGKYRYWFTTFDLMMKHNIFTTPIWQIATCQGSYAVTDKPLYETVCSIHSPALFSTKYLKKQRV